jgi:hypothetical protein
LVDHSKFSAISPLQDDSIHWMPFYKPVNVKNAEGNPTFPFKNRLLIDSLNVEKHKPEKPRQSESIAEFDDYQYKKSYKSGDSNNMTCIETFTDKQSKHIRQNEQGLFMEPVEAILSLANKEGFILHGKVDMTECHGDKHQYLYVLERQM